MAPGSRLQELTAKYMQNPRRYFVPLANEYRKTNELDRAIALCREHLPSQPGHMSGHIVLASAYFEKGDIEAAREVFLTSVALDDENLIALRHLGDIARSRNELADARQWYARVLDADPQNEEIERVLRSLTQPEHAAAGATPDVVRPIAVVAPIAPIAPMAQVATIVMPPIVEPETSALADPTPPGLRAITTPINELGLVSGDVTSALQPVPSRTLDTFDLSTLDDGTGSGGGLTSEDIRVDDGVGFMFDDLDELTDPANTGTTLSLPPTDEADFSAGIQTPTQPAAAVAIDTPDDTPDSLLSRPGFGALASFASWRTAQDRDTPSQQSTQRATPTEPTPGVTQPAAASAADDASLFWDAGSSDSAVTAPEFVTETMASLYVQQGFMQQALDVYRALLSRAPTDADLASRVAELEALVAAGGDHGGDKALQDDADKALQFDDLDDDDDSNSERRSALEDMYDASPPAAGALTDPAFGGGWSADADTARRGEDDWFAEDAGLEAPADGSGFDGIFGVPTDAFGQVLIPSSARESATSGARHGRTELPLEHVFGSALIAAADQTAADMLLALAGQMVGRLPKDAPTLPVPDILELPSSVPGDESTGKSPAPLLSFDRFFSGSGSPPRQRIDTPAARSSTPMRPPSQPAPTPPSLSPTFGGVPVIPPPPSAVTPSSWATFDQFVPPASVQPTPAVTPPSAAVPMPTAPAPAAPTLKPLTRPVPAKPASLPPAQSSSFPTFTGLPSELTSPSPSIDPAKAARDPQKPTGADNAGATDAVDDRALPSEFHRWLEGLS